MPALVTPFDDEGEIDLDAHRHNVRYLQDDGIDGFLIGGSTGEGPYLEPGERGELLEVAHDEAPGAFLLCGINGESVRQAMSLILEAAGSGADAVLVITPTTLVRGNDAAVEAFYLAVGEAAPLPVFLYTVPRVTGYELPVDVVRRLSAHPNIVGMKDSGGRPERIASLSGRVDTPFDMFVGASSAVATSVAAGAHGAITASANYAWPFLKQLLAGSPDEARLHQQRLLRLIETIESLGLAATKAAATMVGLQARYPRLPLGSLSRSQLPVIEASLRDAGLLPVGG